ncbi:hypothetical protein EZJ49_06510 [Bdellovibrio bacteriovorus]|uniref:hypothetical protein n=1 Tax=Bdellovibrio bacteriovorus TaxID=959 RepID=UPI0021CFB929|nr:hypothetical protein [Bdellovibrio bacteriovorus]UXR65898.1 hypothetical protein EZJ49_06510 [Bdellovibrio bacteriovorus]
MKFALPLLITPLLTWMPLAFAFASGGSVSGTIGVSLTIVSAGEVSSSITTEPEKLRTLKALSILTDAKDGAVVDVYINRQHVTSTRSQNGTVYFELNWKSDDRMNLELRSAGRPLQVLQSAYVTSANQTIPKMTVDEKYSYQRQVLVTNEDGSQSVKTVEVKSIVVEY